MATNKANKPEADPQASNEWGGLPDPDNHDCARFLHDEDEAVGGFYCGVCGAHYDRREDASGVQP